MAWYVDADRTPVDLDAVVVDGRATEDVYRLDYSYSGALLRSLWARAGGYVSADSLARAEADNDTDPVPPQPEPLSPPDTPGDADQYAPRVRVRLTADDPLNASDITFQSIAPALSFPVAANEEWDFHALIRYTASVTGDLKFGPVYSGCTVFGTSYARYVTTDNTNRQSNITIGDLGASGSASAAGGADAAVIWLEVQGTVIGGPDGGQFELRFAQQTSDPTAPVIRAGTSLTAVKVA